MCDMSGEQNIQCPPNTGIHRRGDLLVCDKHARMFPANVGRVEGEVRCWCGGFKTLGDECGEPCSY